MVTSAESVVGLSQLIGFLGNTTFNLLLNQGIAGPVAKEIAQGIIQLSPEAVSKLDEIDELSKDVRVALQTVLVLVASALPTLAGETATEEELDQGARAMERAGGIAEEIGDPTFAYNYYEIAWNIGGAYDRPALSIAEKLRALSNPDIVDQHHGAIWRLAIELFRKAVDEQDHWSRAIDAVELALTCRISHPGLRLDLYRRLANQMRRTEGTKVTDIIGIFGAQSPPAFNPAARREARLALARAGGPKLPDTAPEGIIELLALAQGQVMLDDLRLELEPKTSISPEIVWTDLRYRDSRLASAVPGGRSLLVHLHRSGILLLDLAHEIAHAETLQGAVGLRQTAYRTVLNYIEFMLIDRTGQTPDTGLPSAIQELPSDGAAVFLAGHQLRTAILADIERKVWRSWLEGVAVYVELLCDPVDDPSEISHVHAAIRSMIDMAVSPREGESEEEFGRRYMETVAAEFEAFYTQALNLRSRPNHVAYFDTAQGRDASDLYCLGYMVVRSVVAAWENTLGRRLPPMVACKLLLNATKIGTFEMHSQPELADSELASGMQERYLAWLEELRTLSRETLESFFEPVHREAKGRPQVWRNGVPQPVADPDEAIEHRAPFFTQLQARMRRVMGLEREDGSMVDAGEHPEMLAEVFEWNVEASRLLPIGSVNARLLLSEDQPGWMALNVRTYVAEFPKHEDESLRPSRYQLRIWPAGGGETEVEELRREIGRLGTDRLMTTRIIDLNGHPDSPYQSITISYLASFLGPSVKFVQPTGGKSDIAAEFPDFAAAIERRMFPPYGIADEEATIADTGFLTGRLRRIHPTNASVRFADEVAGRNIALEVAFAAADRAFGSESEAFRAIYDHVMGSGDVRRSIALSLFETGRNEAGKVAPDVEGTALGRLIFAASSYSGVRPFGDKA
jgi:hypothetical protein